MISAVTNQVEELINHLSYQERLWLIERLARRLREDAASQFLSASHDWQSDIALMAADPQIQAELRAIEQEFAVTEADGPYCLRTSGSV